MHMRFPSLHILLSFATAVLMAGCTRIAAPEDSGEGGAASSERPHTKKLSGYPYYAYVEPDWQYEEWVSEVVDCSGMLDTVKSSVHTDPEFKQASGYSCNFLKPSKTLPEDQYGCYQFSHYRGENHVIGMDAEEGAEIPSMRVFREGDDVLVEGVALDGRWYS